MDEKVLRFIKKQYVGKKTCFGPITDVEKVDNGYKNQTVKFLELTIDGNGKTVDIAPLPEDLCHEIRERFYTDFIRYKYTKIRGISQWF